MNVLKIFPRALAIFLAVVGAGPLFVPWTAAAQSPDCMASLARLETALGAQVRDDRAALRENAILRSCGMSAEKLTHIQGRIARLMLEKATASGPNVSDDKLKEIFAIQPIWPVAAELANRSAMAQRWSEATAFYNEALISIDNPDLTPAATAPNPAIYSQIREQGQYARLRSLDPPLEVRKRGNRLVGLGTFPRTRTMREDDRIALPITFVTNSIDLDPAGRVEAERLFEVLSLEADGLKSITIIGHTDERGPRLYNQALSVRRATSIAEFFRSKGLRVATRIVGKGEDEPFRRPMEIKETDEERWRVDRRVEVIREID
jgi:outer membrane protein OmpA-like peptidoglycan-associated protein